MTVGLLIESARTARLFRPSHILQQVATWRPAGEVSLCKGFCGKYGTEECPFYGSDALPKEGYCSSAFCIRASTTAEAEELLAADKAAYIPQ